MRFPLTRKGDSSSADTRAAPEGLRSDLQQPPEFSGAAGGSSSRCRRTPHAAPVHTAALAAR